MKFIILLIFSSLLSVAFAGDLFLDASCKYQCVLKYKGMGSFGPESANRTLYKDYTTGLTRKNIEAAIKEENTKCTSDAFTEDEKRRFRERSKIVFGESTKPVLETYVNNPSCTYFKH